MKTLISDLPLTLLILVLFVFWLISCSLLFFSWSEELNFKSPDSVTLCRVEWIPELLSKACWINLLALLNLRIYVSFSLNQAFVCCKFSFKWMFNGLSWDFKLRHWEFCEPYKVISLQNQLCKYYYYSTLRVIDFDIRY